MKQGSHPSVLRQKFQRWLLGARYLVLIAVVASLLVGAGMFVVATFDAISLIHTIRDYLFFATADQHATLRNQVVTHVVEVVDGYLLATVMLIFALGLYSLFIGRIETAGDGALQSGVLLIRTFDDLKDRLGKVVLLILIVKFFEHALEMKIDRPLDLLYLALGIMLIALSIALAHGKVGDTISSAVKPKSIQSEN